MPSLLQDTFHGLFHRKAHEGCEVVCHYRGVRLGDQGEGSSPRRVSQRLHDGLDRLGPLVSVDGRVDPGEIPLPDPLSHRPDPPELRVRRLDGWWYSLPEVSRVIPNVNQRKERSIQNV